MEDPSKDITRGVETFKENLDEGVFLQYDLTDKMEFTHPQGNIRTRLIGKTPDGMNQEMIWGIRKGTTYPPETHTHGHILTIKHGSGIISVNGEEKVYSAGDVFDIAGNVPHGFIRVDETTVVIQKQPLARHIKLPL